MATDHKRYTVNESTSSSSGLNIYEPAFQWGEGYATRYAMAEQLTKDQFSAATIVAIDSCFTQAIYGQHTEKHDERRVHNMQTLHANNLKLEYDAQLAILQAYEFSKEELFNFYAKPEESFDVARSIAKELISYFPPSVQTHTGRDALSW